MMILLKNTGMMELLAKRTVIKNLIGPQKKQTIKNKSIATNIHYYLTYQIKLDTKE